MTTNIIDSSNNIIRTINGIITNVSDWKSHGYGNCSINPKTKFYVFKGFTLAKQPDGKFMIDDDVGLPSLAEVEKYINKQKMTKLNTEKEVQREKINPDRLLPTFHSMLEDLNNMMFFNGPDINKRHVVSL